MTKGLIEKWISKLKNGDSGELVTKGFSYLLIRIGGTFVAVIFSRFVTKNFGADIYGLFASGLSVFLIISVLGRLGLDINIIKFFSLNKANEDSGLFFQSVIKVFISSSLLAAVIYWQREFLVIDVFKSPKPELIPYLNWILPAIPFWSATLLSGSLLRAKGFNNWFSFFNNSSRFFFALILLFIFSFVSSNPITIVQAHFFAIVIAFIWSFSLAFSKLNNKNFKSKTNSWKFTKESFPMMMSSSVLIILGWIGTFVMGIYRESDEVGIYTVAVKVATLLNFCLQAVNSILAPKIAQKFAAAENKDYQSLITLATNIIFVISVFVAILILIFNQTILGFFGEEFKSAKNLLFLLCIGQIVSSYCGSVGVVLQMTGKQVVYQYFMLAALVLNLILMFTLTPIYGAFGAAIASISSMIFWNIGGALYLKKRLKITTYFTIPIKL
ncbi:MAG: flippase [Psychroflexus sp.]|nr:flippase [Psychroflexus sp.]MDR9448910.1 flippase [Psychroflexus sp.]